MLVNGVATEGERESSTYGRIERELNLITHRSHDVVRVESKPILAHLDVDDFPENSGGKQPACQS